MVKCNVTTYIFLRITLSTICSVCRNYNTDLSSFMTYHRVYNKLNTKGARCGPGTDYPSGTPEFTSGFSEVRVARSFVFCAMFCRSLFVILSFFSWPLCCLSFSDLRLLIVSSNFSYTISAVISFHPNH
jgi:hypothetical protein